jgi:hypothetical protein
VVYASRDETRFAIAAGGVALQVMVVQFPRDAAP